MNHCISIESQLGRARRKPVLALGLALLVWIAATWSSTDVQAAPPSTFSYQGYLTKANATPVDAPVTLTFRLYDTPTGGVPLYTETHAASPVNNGVFNVLIGSITPIPPALVFDTGYYLGVSVDADTELTPRQPLSATPYAFHSQLAGSLTPSATVAGSQITGALSTATLPATSLAGVVPITSGGTGAATKSFVDLSNSQTIDGSKTFLLQIAGSTTGNVLKSGDKMTGPLLLSGDPTSVVGATTKQYVDSSNATKLNKAGDTMTGPLILAADPAVALGATTKQYVDTEVSSRLAKNGADTMLGDLNLGGHRIRNVGTPTVSGDAATFDFVVASATTNANYASVFSSSTQNATQNASTAIKFNTFPQLDGWIYASGTGTLTCPKSGLYLVEYSGYASEIMMYARTNAVVIPGSQAATHLGTSTFSNVTRSFIANFSSGDLLDFQMATTSTPAGLGPNTVLGISAPSVSVTIVRIK